MLFNNHVRTYGGYLSGLTECGKLSLHSSCTEQYLVSMLDAGSKTKCIQLKVVENFPIHSDSHSLNCKKTDFNPLGIIHGQMLFVEPLIAKQSCGSDLAECFDIFEVKICSFSLHSKNILFK